MFGNLFLSKLSAFKSNNSVLPHGISCNLLLVVEKDVYDDFSSKSETPIFLDITGEFNLGEKVSKIYSATVLAGTARSFSINLLV